MITVEIGNVGSEKQAKKIKAALEGKTFYEMRVDYACAVNNWPVTVSTDYKATAKTEEDEDDARLFREMVMYILATSL